MAVLAATLTSHQPQYYVGPYLRPGRTGQLMSDTNTLRKTAVDTLFHAGLTVRFIIFVRVARILSLGKDTKTFCFAFVHRRQDICVRLIIAGCIISLCHDVYYAPNYTF